MNTGSSPLGRYADIAALFGSIAIVAAFLLSVVVFPGRQVDKTLESAFLIAIGILFGTRTGFSNGTAAVVANLASAAKQSGDAANQRLDSANVPSAVSTTQSQSQSQSTKTTT